MRIGILGATGPAGSALAARLASVGHEVVVGSRSSDRAVETCEALRRRWPDHELALEPADNAGAATAEVVVVATPWDAASSTAVAVGDRLTGKVVISMANAIARIGREFQPLVPPRGSVAAAVQAAVPASMVAAAFHHIPAKELGDLAVPVDGDVLVCADHPEAVEVTAAVVAGIPHLRPLNAGTLSQAAPIEVFAAVLLQLNAHYRTRVSLRFTGLDGPGAAPAADG